MYVFRLSLLVLVLLLSACSENNLTWKGIPLNITGRMVDYTNLAPQNAKAFSKDAAITSQCTPPIAKLYKLDASGDRIEPELTHTEVNDDGTFVFSLKNIDISFKDGVATSPLIVNVSACGKIFNRPITGPKNQDVSHGSTLLTYALNTSEKNKLSESLLTNKDTVEALIKTLQEASTEQEAYTLLASNSEAQTSFQEILGAPPSVLSEASPQILSLSIPSMGAELQTTTLSVSSSHWLPSYNIVYIWKVDNTQISQNASTTFTPHANSQGTHTVTLYVGKDDGSGGLDLTKPYKTLAQTITVQNSIPALAPTVTLSTASPTNLNVINVALNTGAGFANCSSFSRLAVTVNDPVAPLDLSQYNITCTQAGSQIQSVTLPSGDGPKYIRFWALDSSNNISIAPSSATLILDQNPPLVSIQNPGSAIRGGTSQNVQFTAEDIGAGVSQVLLELSQDGTNYSLLTTVNSPTSKDLTYTWVTPTSNTSTAQLRVRAQDQAGSWQTATTTSFSIDSLAPTAPVISRTSAAVSNSTAVTINTSCLADYDKVAYSQSAVVPGLTDPSWEDCAASKNFTVTNGDELKTIYVFAKDIVGNISSANLTMVLDQTNPSLTLTGLPLSPTKGGSIQTISWAASDSHLTATPVSLEYSLDNGSNWTTIAGNLNNGANAGCAIPGGSTGCYPWTLPLASSAQLKIKATVLDQANNSGSGTSATMTIDSSAPTLSSFQLADGLLNIAMPSTTFSISATDALSSVTHLRISENSTFADSGWTPYSTSGNFTLSSTNGLKNVYAWVKDSAGNISSSVSTSITLDFGAPPVVSITGPSQGSTYTSPQTVPISWSCTTSNALSATPITIKYTVNDGTTFTTIQSGLTNNLTATTGSYDWTLPAGVSVFRLLIECESAAGVRSSAYSGILNSSTWSIYAGDPWYGLTNVNALLANISASGRVPTAADTNNNIYYVKGNSIMKINAQSGLVTTWANTTGNAGSGAADGMNVSDAGATLSSPRILGANANGQLLYIQNGTKVFSINFASGTYSLRADLTGYTVNQYFVTKNDLLLFFGGAKLHSLDLATTNATPVLIHGNGTCSTPNAIGTNAATSPIPITNLSPPICPGEANLMANADASKIWISFFNVPSAGYRLDKSGSDYLIAANMAGNYSGNQQCIFTRFDENVYCVNRHTGRSIYPFNTLTGAFSAGYSIPFANNDDSGFLNLGSMNDKLISAYSLNTIQTHTTPSTGGWSSTIVAGQPLTIMGNGTGGLNSVGFQDPRDIKYNAATNSLFVRNWNGHIRKINYSTNPPTVSTLFSTALWNNSPYFSLSPSGNAITTPASCGRLYNFKIAISGESLSHAFYLNGPCNQATGINPPASGTNALDGSVLFTSNYTTGGVLMHSNGNVYMSTGTSATSDVMIYELTGSVINRIAGKTGLAAYNAADHGATAQGASLCNAGKILMQEIASGTYAGDLLILDCDRLRRISITTESVTPKIYDVVPMTLAAGWVAGLTPTDFIYDQNTETGGTLGTGTVYYATGTSVRKWVPDAALTAASDTAYNFTGTTLSGTLRITLAPAGLLVLQPNKARILRVAP